MKDARNLMQNDGDRAEPSNPNVIDPREFTVRVQSDPGVHENGYCTVARPGRPAAYSGSD